MSGCHFLASFLYPLVISPCQYKHLIHVLTVVKKRPYIVIVCTKQEIIEQSFRRLQFFKKFLKGITHPRCISCNTQNYKKKCMVINSQAYYLFNTYIKWKFNLAIPIPASFLPLVKIINCIACKQVLLKCMKYQCYSVKLI